MDVLRELIKAGLVKQVGVIVYGKGLNVRNVIEEVRKKYYVLPRKGWAELYL